MEWRTLHGLQVGGVAQAAAFHPTLPLLVVSAGRHIAEYDVVTGCQVARADIGGAAVRIGYSTAAGHIVVAALEDATIRAWDQEVDQTHVLFTPSERRGADGKAAETHMALPPTKPWVFFAGHKRLSVNVIGALDTVRPPASKLKTDTKKPITALACHPRQPILFVAYTDGTTKAFNSHALTPLYTLQLDEAATGGAAMSAAVRLVGASAFAFHHTLDHVFVGDAGGAVTAWDVSVPTRPNLVGVRQVGAVSGSNYNTTSVPVSSVAWHPTLQLLLVVLRDGSVKAFSARIVRSAHLQQAAMQQPLASAAVAAAAATLGGPVAAWGGADSFFEEAVVEELDVTRLMGAIAQQQPPSSSSAAAAATLLRSILMHARLNFVACVCGRVSAEAAEDVDARRRMMRAAAGHMSRESRRMLLEVLQNAKLNSADASMQRERLAAGVGASYVVSEKTLQQQLMLMRGQSKLVQPTFADYTRKMFLYGASPSSMSSLASAAVSSPAKRSSLGPLVLPVLRLEDPLWPIHDTIVRCPVHLDMRFFQGEQAIFKYPARALLMDPAAATQALQSYSMPTAVLSLLARFPPVDAHGAQRRVSHAVYSHKQQTLLVFFRAINPFAAAAIPTGGEGEGAAQQQQQQHQQQAKTTTSVIVQRFVDVMEPLGEGIDTLTHLTGGDGTFTGRFDRQFVLLDEDGYVLSFHALPDANKSPEEEEEEQEEREREEEEAGQGKAGKDEGEDTTFTGFASRFDEVAEVVETKTRRAEAVADGEAIAEFMFETPVQRIFGTPLDKMLLYVCAGSHVGMVEAYVDADGRADGDLVTVDGDDSGYRYLRTRKQEGKPYLSLKPQESVLEVWWQAKHDGPVAAIMTTARVMIVSSSLVVLSSVVASSSFNASFPPFTSSLWVGPTLLFTTATEVAALGWDSVARPLVALDKPDSVLVAAVNDRLLLASRTSSSVGAVVLEVRPRLAGLLEPLLLGWVTLLHAHANDPQLQAQLPRLMEQLVQRFDCQRVTPRLVEVLSRGPAVACDLAIEIAESGPQFTAELRALCAVRARRFESAVRIVRAEFNRSRAYPKCPPASPLFHAFRALGRRCIWYGQFDRALEAFETVGDHEAMFDLFLTHMNPSALRRLTHFLSDTGEDPELQRACEHVLKVRSALWTSASAGGGGGGLSNTLALAPKPADWAGGNWTIKTPSSAEGKGKRGGGPPGGRWELSTEVMAYMKTAGGPIPVIFPADSVSVYLGTVRGKGVVTEIIEIKPLAREGEGGKKGKKTKKGKKATEEEIMAAAAASFVGPGGVGGSGRGEGKGSSRAEDPEEAQRRAELEFKRGILADGSGFDSDSSDDDDTSSQRGKIKISIRAKADAAAGIDAVRLRQATLTLADPTKQRAAAAAAPAAGDQLQTSWQSFDAAAADSAAAAAAGVPGAPLWAPQAAAVGAAGAVAGGGVPPQAVALGWAAPQAPLVAAAGAAAAGGPPGAHGLQLALVPVGAAAGGFEDDGFGDQPFVAQPTATAAGTQMLALPAPPGAAGLPQPPPQEFGGLLAGGEQARSADAAGRGTADPLAPGALAAAAAALAGGAPAAAAAPTSAPLPPELRALAAADSAAAAAAAAGQQQQQQGGTSAQAAQAQPTQPAATKILPGFVPRGESAAVCFKAALVHIDDNRLTDAVACLDEGFMALARDRSVGKDVSQQAKLCAVYKIAASLLQEISRLQAAEGKGAVGAKEEMARLSRHLAALPLQPRHRISCMRTAVRRNMECQNFAYARKVLDALCLKAPPAKQPELRALANVCTQRGLTDRTINPTEDASAFCAATLSVLPTIGHDRCDVCAAAFAALPHPGCPVCGMGTVRRSDARPAPSRAAAPPSARAPPPAASSSSQPILPAGLQGLLG